jgi:hypothetical protein
VFWRLSTPLAPFATVSPIRRCREVFHLRPSYLQAPIIRAFRWTISGWSGPPATDRADRQPYEQARSAPAAEHSACRDPICLLAELSRKPDGHRFLVDLAESVPLFVELG